jgi:SAM-dependent methyltransferase
VGLDADPAAFARARATLDRLGVHGVDLSEADVNSLDQITTLGRGRFDLGYRRLFLMHQRDPAATVRQIARLVRSGGRIVARDVLADPNHPRFEPAVPARERTRRLYDALVARSGRAPDVARQYQRICEQADLRLIEQRGAFIGFDDPGDGVAAYRDFWLSMRGNLVAEHLATDEEIDALARELDAARGTVEFATSPLSVEMIAEVP